LGKNDLGSAFSISLGADAKIKNCDPNGELERCSVLRTNLLNQKERNNRFFG